MSDPALLPVTIIPPDPRLRLAADRARASWRRLQQGVRDELGERLGWRAVMRAHPELCLGAALAVGFLLGRRR